MEGLDLSHAAWSKSTFSANSGQCVEVAVSLGAGVVAVRDSKDADGPVLVIGVARWREFTEGLKAGEYDSWEQELVLARIL